MVDKKIVDFSAFAKDREDKKDLPVYNPYFDLGAATLVMGLGFQLDLLKKKAIEYYSNGTADGIYIHRFLEIVSFITSGILEPFDSVCNIFIRDEVAKKTPNVLLTLINLERLKDAALDDVPPNEEFSIEVSFIGVDHDTSLSTGRHVPADRIIFETREDASFSPQMLKHMVSRLNFLLKINGGCGILTKDRKQYVTFLPYSGTRNICLAMEFQIPLKVIE